MRFILLTCFLIFAFVFAACSPPATDTNKNLAVNTATNKNAASGNSNAPLSTTKTPEPATANNSPTIAPVVAGFYEALQKKDEAGVKKYLSAAALKYYENESKAEKKTWLAFLSENEDPVGEKRDVRNEKIEGDIAVAELKGGNIGVWTKYKFVKENGEWKFASPADSPELEAVSKSASNSSTAK